jgi:hypothetical protein
MVQGTSFKKEAGWLLYDTCAMVLEPCAFFFVPRTSPQMPTFAAPK